MRGDEMKFGLVSFFPSSIPSSIPSGILVFPLAFWYSPKSTALYEMGEILEGNFEIFTVESVRKNIPQEFPLAFPLVFLHSLLHSCIPPSRPHFRNMLEY